MYKIVQKNLVTVTKIVNLRTINLQLFKILNQSNFSVAYLNEMHLVFCNPLNPNN